MTKHINNLCRSAHFTIRNIARIRPLLTQSAAEKLVHAFVTTKLDYCNSLLFGLPKYLIKRLQLVQNHAARVVTITPKYDHISHILEKLHWLPVEQRITYKICLLTYKSLNNMGPIYLKDLLHPYSPGHSGLRSADKSLLREPKFRYANFGRRAFARAAPHHWNSVIPLALRQCTSLGSFKKSLKCHLYIDAFN